MSANDIRFTRGNTNESILDVAFLNSKLGFINHAGNFECSNIEQCCIGSDDLRRIANKCDEVKDAIKRISLR